MPKAGGDAQGVKITADYALQILKVLESLKANRLLESSDDMPISENMTDISYGRAIRPELFNNAHNIIVNMGRYWSDSSLANAGCQGAC